ncbi:hypothetical protein DBR47_19220 [Paucibacter sp. KBW04]|uniref:TonB-dependent receptor plug domain-containing protein n=1 Tax=Paucibacter sp. KBW04 TaxID=2153361 RepID=UPI000F572C92|nr:TonB-dependent receptor [Paucibacter sp. KBW04]RQO55993.1 hypothetical protein DBR47_19220 [Paucibacter sp. KBW04]
MRLTALLLLSLLTPDVGATETLDAVRIQAQRQDARVTETQGKIVIQQAELLRLGDSQLSEALKRLPGVSSTPGPVGQPPVLSLRGLGAGYTQILLNGRKAPQGFSLDEIAPEQVERVEILRASGSQHSAEALAGSINIVLKPASAKPGQQAQAEYASSPAQTQSRLQASGSGPWPDSAASFAWAAQLSRRRFEQLIRSDEQGSFGQHQTREQREGVLDVLRLAPQFSASDGSKWAGSLELGRLRRDSAFQTLTQAGRPPVYPQHHEAYAQRYHKLRAEASQTWLLSPESELSLELAGGLHRQHADFTDVGASLDDHTWGDLRQGDISERLQLSLDAAADHRLSLGSEASLQARRETRLQTLAGFSDSALDASARLARAALFVQDEWTLSPKVSLSAGLRWEHLLTRSEAQTHSAQLLLPSAQLRWQLPQAQGRVRLALARSFAAPTAAELLPRPFTSTNNSPLTPDYQGNPNLRPETAWGLDLAYEREAATGHSFNLGLFARRRQDHKMVELVQQDYRWIERPANMGAAQTWGIESDGRWVAGLLLALRYNLTYSWTRREALQHSSWGDSANWQLNLGLDLKLPQAWTLAASFKTGSTGWSPDSLSSRSQSRGVRELDLSASRSLGPSSTLRLSLANALATGFWERSQWQQGEQSQEQIKQRAQPLQLKLGLEWRG